MFAGAIGKHRDHSSFSRARRVLLGLALVTGFTLQAAPSAYASPPTARTSTVSTREGVPVYVFLHAVDPETDPLTYTTTSQPAHGSLGDCAPGYCLYTPDPGFVGVDSFSWTASDATGTSSAATAAITVTKNIAPQALSQSVPVRSDGPFSFSLDWRDSDYTGVTFEVLTQPTHGELTGCEATYCTYTPDAGFTGSDSFTWRVSDDLATSNTATATLSVFGNVAPSADDSTDTVREGKQEEIVLDYAQQPGESLTFSVVDNPQHGTVNCVGYIGYCYYEGFAGYTGPDSFTWQVSDGLLDSRVATVGLTVRPNAAPTALDVTEPYNNGNYFYMASFDPDGDLLTTSIVSNPAHGTVTCSDLTTYPYCSYVADAGFTGSDTFTWQASDGLATSRVATTTMLVDQPSALIAYNANGTAYEGQTSSLYFPYSGGTSSPAVTVVSPPGHGTLTGCSVPLNGCTYVPASGFSGQDSVTWRITDGSATSNVATFSITVIPNARPLAYDVSWDVRQQTSLSLSLNGYDPEGATATFAVVSGPTHGSLTSCTTGSCTYTPTGNYVGFDSFTWRVSAGGGTSRTATLALNVHPNNPPGAYNQFVELNEGTPTVLGLSWYDDYYYYNDAPSYTFTVLTPPSHGTLTACSTGACTYTPDANFRGADSFTWKVGDGLADSNPATVSLFVLPVTAPVAINTSASVRQNRSEAVGLSWSSLSGNPAAITVVAAPAHGAVSCDVNYSYCTYTPTTGYTGPDAFTWKLNDGFADSNTATVSITVRANAAPVAVDDTATTPSNTAVAVLMRASDADGDTMTYAVQSGPTHGALSACTLVTNGWAQCTYTPTASFVGTDSISFRASDDLASSAVATTTITVTGQPPVVNSGTDKTGTEGVPISLTGTASDPDGQALTYQWSATAGPGVDAGAGCSFSAPTSLTTTVTCTDNGTFTATLTASDGGSSTSDSATLTIANANPSVSITAPLAGAQVDSGVAVQVTAPITDPATNDTFGCNIAWGDTTTTAGAIVAGACTGSHTYATAGEKTITVSVNDDDAGTASASVTITQKAQVNLPPTANAGADRTGGEGDLVQLPVRATTPRGSAHLRLVVCRGLRGRRWHGLLDHLTQLGLDDGQLHR